MAAGFRSVNHPKIATTRHSPAAAAMTPSSPSTTTARKSSRNDSPAPERNGNLSTTLMPATSSPVSGQMPLPSSTPDRDANAAQPANAGSAAPRTKTGAQTDAMDVDRDSSDGEEADSPNGDHNGSDNQGSEDADGTNSQRKKKSQKFYCTDYPPCNLSFTRSEHLARHIRKHTGERPFQCHCARRFSRLDNLRQHAQTVHLNEAIPADSPAAHGSRYQRQQRQERVRVAGHRARASTGGSAGGPVRGHSKSLSTSSINSMSSVGSAYSNSTYSSQIDPRRRPPPLVMAADPRVHPGVEYRPVEGAYYGPPSPEYSTPTSATFSTAQTSPTRWGPGMTSPSVAHSRSHSLYSVDEHPHQRRLSVPSSQNPFQSSMGRSGFAPVPSNASPGAAFSPTTSNYMSSPNTAWSARRDSVSSNSDDSWRRRTWHSDSRNADPQAPNPPPPIVEQPSTPQAGVRLPGIDTFGPFLNRDVAPPPVVDPELTPRRGPPSIDPSPMERPRNANLYEPNLQRGLHRLEIAHSPVPSQSPGGWGPDPREDTEPGRSYTPAVRFQEAAPARHQPSGPARASRSLHQYTMSAPSVSARDNRRHGWYAGPPQDHHAEPDQRAARVERMEHPNMTAFAGFPQREPERQERGQERRGDGDPLGRLEALVAVATSEGTTATAY